VPSKLIDIRVSHRVLWVADEAYPLQNIARARTAKLVPKRAGAVVRLVVVVLLWVGLAVAGRPALTAARVPRATRDLVLGYASTGLVVLVAVCAIWMVVVVLRRPLYALVIETAGTPFTAVVSPDRDLISRLVHSIMDAIDNPAAEFGYRIENYYGGNHVKQFGDNNVGVMNR
jgi:hypothetical protein